MNTRAIAILLDRVSIALGSLSLVDKELVVIQTVLTEWSENSRMNHPGDEKEKSDSDFFITPPLEVYSDE